MEWLLSFFELLLIVIKWIFIVVVFLITFIFSVVALVNEFMARDERRMYEGRDDSWKFFRLIAIVFCVLACLFGLLGYLLI